MRICSNLKLLLWTVAAVMNTLCLSAQVAETNLDVSALREKLATENFAKANRQYHETNLAPNRPGYVWGPETNGFKCGMSLNSWPGIRAFICAPLTNINVPDFAAIKDRTNLPPLIYPGFMAPKSPTYLRYPWLGPTNQSPGMMELRSDSGELVAVRNRTLNDPESYPDFLRESTLRTQIPPNLLGGIWQRFDAWKDCQESGSVPFRLDQYFELTKPGIYTLTLGAKIYRSSENPEEDYDLYQRIDLPPVTISFRWPEGTLVKRVN